MEASSYSLAEILLTTSRTLALLLNEKLTVRVLHNAPLLAEWRGDDAAQPGSLRLLLEELLPLPQARAIMPLVEAQARNVDQASVLLGTAGMRAPYGGGTLRYLELSLHRGDEASGLPLLLMMRDVTPLVGLQQTLSQTQDSLTAAMAALRAPPQRLRLFLSAAMASIGALRATMKLPARNQEAVHDKLARLQAAADQLGADARHIGLATVAEACSTFAQRASALREVPQLSGDDLLPLAPLLDQVAFSVGSTVRIDEQRYVAAPKTRAAAPNATTPRETRTEASEWARIAERRWNKFLRQRGEELGTLVKLQVQQAQLAPPELRRDIDDILQHLLRNAVEHGIETPEQRLAAAKPASGQISVQFEDKGRGLLMTVRDDGRGFDVERIGRAAILSGLASDESLLEFDPGEVVGLIFKASFSTEHLEGESGRGRGMNFLRRAVTRLGGQITVATKPGRYTRFVIQMPADSYATTGIKTDS